MQDFYEKMIFITGLNADIRVKVMEATPKFAYDTLKVAIATEMLILDKKDNLKMPIKISAVKADESETEELKEEDDEEEAALKRLFTPEFRNRLDAVVAFKPLTQDIIRQVVQKFVMQLEAQLADRNVTIETSDDAADWLAKNGFDELYGARPLARVIQEHIKKPLADDILFGKLSKGGHVKVVLKDGKIAFEFEVDAAKGRAPGAPEIEEPVLAD